MNKRCYILDETEYEKLPSLLKRACICGNTPEQKYLLFLSTLGVASGVIECEVVYEGLTYHPNLFVIVIAPAASGKSLMKLPLILLDGVNEERKQKSLNSLAISANISSAALYEDLESNGGSGVILETEIDTLSAAMKQDWGNFGDVLRKAFGQETISIKRSQKPRVVIERPKFSVILSGTPKQLAPLMGSVENGLFSRILFENLLAEFKWRRVHGRSERDNLEEYFAALKDEFKDFILYTNKNPFELVLTESQWKELNNYFQELTELNTDFENLRATVFRLPIICLKILLVLTAFRRYERHLSARSSSEDDQQVEHLSKSTGEKEIGSTDDDAEKLTEDVLRETLSGPMATCNTSDFMLVMEMVFGIISNAKMVAKNLPADAPVGIKPALWAFYNKLPDEEFTMEEVLLSFDLDKSDGRTTYRRLEDLVKMGLLEKLGIRWKKTSKVTTVTKLTSLTIDKPSDLS